MKWFRQGLADALAEWAQARRDRDFVYRDAWERETEPGFKMTGMAEAGSDMSMAIAGVQDALADAIRPAA